MATLYLNSTPILDKRFILENETLGWTLEPEAVEHVEWRIIPQLKFSFFGIGYWLTDNPISRHGTLEQALDWAKEKGVKLYNIDNTPTDHGKT